MSAHDRRSSVRAIALAAAALFAPAAAPAPPLAGVVVAPVALTDVAPATPYIGRVQAIQSVALIARVPAFVERIEFAEGGLVTAGQTLFALQKAPYQAALEQAQAALQKSRAVDANAQFTVDRDAQMIRSRVVSPATYATDTATLKSAAADTLAAQAALENAAINLSYTTIITPIGGRIGRATFTMGNLVGPTTGALATVVQVDPIRVVFSMADRDVVDALAKTGHSQAQLNAALVLRLTLPGGQAYAQTGGVEFIDNRVDPGTGTLAVWGRFANPQGLLIPGGFVTVSVRQAAPQRLPTVPVQSVQDDADGAFVLLVDPAGLVRQQKITLGAQIGQSWVVTAGLAGGENVIVQGYQKVAAGQHVKPVPQASLAAGGK